MLLRWCLDATTFQEAAKYKLVYNTMRCTLSFCSSLFRWLISAVCAAAATGVSAATDSPFQSACTIGAACAQAPTCAWAAMGSPFRRSASIGAGCAGATASVPRHQDQRRCRHQHVSTNAFADSVDLLLRSHCWVRRHGELCQRLRSLRRVRRRQRVCRLRGTNNAMAGARA